MKKTEQTQPKSEAIDSPIVPSRCAVIGAGGIASGEAMGMPTVSTHSGTATVVDIADKQSDLTGS